MLRAAQSRKRVHRSNISFPTGGKTDEADKPLVTPRGGSLRLTADKTFPRSAAIRSSGHNFRPRIGTDTQNWSGRIRKTRNSPSISQSKSGEQSRRTSMRSRVEHIDEDEGGDGYSDEEVSDSEGEGGSSESGDGNDEDSDGGEMDEHEDEESEEEEEDDSEEDEEEDGSEEDEDEDVPDEEDEEDDDEEEREELNKSSFYAGEVIRCPSCYKNMRAPVRAHVLRCASCRNKIHRSQRGAVKPPAALKRNHTGKRL